MLVLPKLLSRCLEEHFRPKLLFEKIYIRINFPAFEQNNFDQCWKLFSSSIAIKICQLNLPIVNARNTSKNGGNFE